MKIKHVKSYKYARPTTTKDDEANTVTSWELLGSIQANIYPGGGQVQTEKYGKDINYVRNLLTNDAVLKEGDGIFVDVDSGDSPDYIVKSIAKRDKLEPPHYEVELMKI